MSQVIESNSDIGLCKVIIRESIKCPAELFFFSNLTGNQLKLTYTDKIVVEPKFSHVTGRESPPYRMYNNCCVQ